MDCPEILKMSRNETPGLEEGNEGCTSIDAPFSKTTQKTIRSGFLCMQHITGVGKRLYREYGSQGCSRIPVVVRRLVSRLFEDQCQLPIGHDLNSDIVRASLYRPFFLLIHSSPSNHLLKAKLVFILPSANQRRKTCTMG